MVAYNKWTHLVIRMMRWLSEKKAQFITNVPVIRNSHFVIFGLTMDNGNQLTMDIYINRTDEDTDYRYGDYAYQGCWSSKLHIAIHQWSWSYWSYIMDSVFQIIRHFKQSWEINKWCCMMLLKGVWTHETQRGFWRGWESAVKLKWRIGKQNVQSQSKTIAIR